MVLSVYRSMINFQHNKTSWRNQASRQTFRPFLKGLTSLFPKMILLLVIFLGILFHHQVRAEYFFWILEVFPEGVYGPSLRFPVPKEGELYQSGTWKCTSENGWNDVNGWMLIESRSVVRFKKGADATRTLQLLCREHESTIARSEQRLDQKNLLLEPDRPGTSIFLQLSCMPLNMRMQK